MKRLFNLKNKKKISLSLVALILVMLMTIGITYSWIDDVKQIEITTTDDAEDTPLKTGVDINAKVNVTKKNNTINLGNMIKDSDIKLNDGEGELKYDDTNHTKNYDTDTINSKKGYFYESGDMHLSGCYSDGEHFYFPKSNGNYREGNKDDENVNYISFTVQITSEYADVDFWFRYQPKIYEHGTTNAIAYARYAINADGKNHVYSSGGSALTCNSNLSGTTAVSGVRKTSTYTYNHDDNTTDDRGKNSNVLFSVKKGDTAIVTFKIWLENGFDTSISATDIDMSLVSSWAYSRKVTIIDKTTGPNDGVSWINKNSAKLFVTLPEFLKDRNSDVDQWDDLTATNDYSIPFYEINSLVQIGSDDDGSYKYYEIQVPLVFNNSELILYRCNSTAWNNSASDAVARSSYNVHCWNWWRTYLPNTYKGATYTLYGSSMDQTAHTTFGTTITNKGYGTWGGVEKISVYSHDTVEGNYNNNGGSYSISTEWATSNNHNRKMFVKDYSDESSSGEVYIYTMYRENDNNSTPWVVYMPKSSALIQFDIYYDNAIKGTWGYRSWVNEACPQQRPLKSDIYDSNSTVYHITANDGVPYGRGYWEGANCVYIIKSGWLSSASSVKAYMWWNNTSANKTTENSADPGETVTQLTKAGDSSTNIYYNTNSPVYKTTAPFPKGFKDIKFTYMNGDDQGDSSNNLVLFPGCFYLPDTNNHDQDGRWLGSLTDTGRSASGSSEASGDDDTGTGTISGYTVDSGFTVQLNGTHTVYTNSSGDTFKVRLPLNSGDNWTTFQKNSLNYGFGSSGKYYTVPSSGLNISLVKGVSNNISLRASSAGNYIVTFTYDNGNTNTIKIDSVLVES